jgi:hypothetical protein
MIKKTLCGNLTLFNFLKSMIQAHALQSHLAA